MANNKSATSSSVFHIRALIWQELVVKIYPAAEVLVLSRIIGNSKIERNENLHSELRTLVEILQEYQASNDEIRDSIQQRGRGGGAKSSSLGGESMARTLLKNQLKLLVDNYDKTKSLDDKVLGYVLNDDDDCEEDAIPITPRMKDLEDVSSLEEGAMLVRDSASSRPRTTDGERHSHRQSRRPDSAVSNISAPAAIEKLELSLDDVDRVKVSMQEALDEEAAALLEDIEFIQECIDMENEMIINDQRVASIPTMQELREFGEELEKRQRGVANDNVDEIVSKVPSGGAAGGALPPKPPAMSLKSSAQGGRRQSSGGRIRKPEATFGKSTRRIRGLVQEARDEEFLS